MTVAKIGEFSEQVIKILNLDVAWHTPLLISKSSYDHILEKHKDDYMGFAEYISEILKSPDYVGINPKDNSIEYVKEFKTQNKFIKVAVRVSGNGKYFVRSMYELKKKKVERSLKEGRLKKVD